MSATIAMNPTEWMTKEQAARHFAVSLQTIHRWVNVYPDNFPTKHHDGTLYIHIAEVVLPDNIRPKNVPVPKTYLTLEEAMARYKISESTLQKWMRSGQLTSVRHSGRTYIDSTRTNMPDSRIEPSAEWKPIPGYPGYEVTRDGRMRNAVTFRQMNPSIEDGVTVRYQDEHGTKRRILLTRAVALAWVPNPENKPLLRHLDENSQNHAASNLAWETIEEKNAREALPSEVWKPASLAGYKVSNKGRIMNRRDKIITPNQDAKGKYLEVSGYADPTSKVSVRLVVHREVARAFLPGFSEEKVVSHLNRNYHDNRVENLVVLTHTEKNTHTHETRANNRGIRIRVTKEDGTVQEYPSYSAAARETGLNANTIRYAVTNGTNLAGYRWEKLESITV